MNTQLFDVNKFNIIEDEEYYYFFRALNNADNKDIENGTILGKNGFTRIRTDRERWEENGESRAPKYSKESEISLEQVYDHIKMHYRKDTNCISLSSNANVSIVYGRGNYSDRYAMIKVPKKEIGEKVFNAGQYMLQEISKEVDTAIAELDTSLDAEILNRISKVDNAETLQDIINIMKDLYSKLKQDEEKTYRGKKVDFAKMTPVTSRISSYQSLNEKQTLEKNKIVAKLTILELSKKMKTLIPHTKTNSKLLETIGNAFSSSEQVYYGDIPGEQVQEVSKEMMDILALLQQQEKSNPVIKDIEKELLNYINAGYHIEETEGKIVFTNGTDKIELKDSQDSSLNKEYHLTNDMTIESMYEITQGKVSYNQSTSLVEKIFYLSKSRNKAREFSEILNSITKNNPEYQEIIQVIFNDSFTIEPEIITRLNHRGYQLSEAVSLDLRKDELELIEYVKSLNYDKLQEILENGGKSDIAEIISRHFSDAEKLDPIDKNTYYANAIIDSYNWARVGIEFTDEEREEIGKRLQQTNCVELYNKLKQEGISEKDIPKIVLNIVTREKFSNILEEGNLKESLKELNKDLSIEQVERYLGYFDIPNTGITLKEYQQRAVDKVDTLFEEKKFASVILPTGAGKSFVALDQLLKHKDEQMVYFAPSNEILEQIKDKIVKYIHGKEGTLGKSNDEIVKEVFPGLSFETYQSLLYKTPEEINKSKYQFMVLDELHRTGASEWEKKLDTLLEAQDENLKVLGITATPQRDRGGKDMAYDTALKLGYTEEELKDDKHIAMKMDLIDAIRAGIVVNPLLVSCEYNLTQDGTLERLVEKIKTVKDEERRKELENKYNNLRKRLDNAKGIPELLETSITKKDGKYIVFIPVSDNGTELEDENGNKVKSKIKPQEKILEAQKQIAEWLKNIDAEPEFYSMLGEYGNKKNAKELHDFENSNSEHIKVMVVMNKLNEGIHVDGIDGIIWQRSLDEDSKILLLQQLGRCIYAIDENDSNNDRPIIIDLPNNMLKIDLHKEVNTYTPKDDLILLEEAVDWIHMHNERIPDINGTSREEARRASTLKRIQAKYSIYLEEFGDDLEQEDIEKINKIISLGEEIDLWNEVFPEKENKEQDIDISIDTFKLTGELKELYDLQNEVDNEINKTIVSQTIEVCKILKANGVDLSKINLSKTVNGKKYQFLLKEIKQKGIDIAKIIEENKLDGEFEFGKNVTNSRAAYKGTGTCIITEEEKREMERLGLVLEEKSIVSQTIEVARILKANGVDLSKIKLSKRVTGKGRYFFLLKEIEQEGVDIAKIIEENGLDGEFEFGRYARNSKTAYREYSSYAITKEEKRELEELGLVPGKTIVAQTIEVTRILKANGVDIDKITIPKTVDGKPYYFLLKDIKQEGIDIEKIIKENGLDQNFEIEENIIKSNKAYKGNKDYKITQEEKRQLEELGLILEKKKSKVEEPVSIKKRKSITAQTIEIARILKANGVDLSKINLSKTVNGSNYYFLLKEIEQEGIDIAKIIEENGVDGNFKFGYRVTNIRRAYKGKGTYVIEEKEKRELEELGLISTEKKNKSKKLESIPKEKSMVSQTIEIAWVLKNNGVDLSKIKLSKRVKGKERHFFLLKEIEQKGVDIVKIIEENGLDGEFKFGQKVKNCKNAYKGRGNCAITKEEKRMIEELGLIELEISGQDIGKATFDAPTEVCDELQEDLNEAILKKQSKNIGDTN